MTLSSPVVTLRHRVLRGWNALWRGEPEASDLPMQGEHRVARFRFGLTAVLTIVGLVVVLVDPTNLEYRRAIPVNLLCLALALGILVYTCRGICPPWLGIITALGDVTVVSLLHVAELWQGSPSMAVNGRVTFAGYFLALVGTSIRWNRKLALIAGLVAAGQYLLIANWASSVWPAVVTRDIVLFGQFDWGVQVERAVVLLLFAGICWSIAGWAVELRTNATHDALTGLLNRRSFEERLHDQLLFGARRKEPVSVALVDIDHFKQVNDAFGHAAGDAALTSVAGLIKDPVRRTDSVARWGGEEFALILPNATGADAHRNMDRVRHRVSSLTLGIPRGLQIRLTISIGIATSPEDGTTVSELVRAADERLLAAKRAGRNLVISGSSQLATVND